MGPYPLEYGLFVVLVRDRHSTEALGGSGIFHVLLDIIVGLLNICYGVFSGLQLNSTLLYIISWNVIM